MFTIYKYFREVPIKTKAIHLLVGLFFIDVLMQVLFAVTLNSKSVLYNKLFHLDVEKNIPSFYSSIKLFLAGILAIDCMQVDKKGRFLKIPYRFVWLFIGVFLLLMGIDEYLSFHEDFDQILFRLKVISPAFDTLGGYGLPWTIIGATIAAIVALPASVIYIKIFYDYKYLLFTLFTAGFIFVLGAIGAENFDMYMQAHRGYEGHAVLMFEEFFEMIAISIVCFVFMRYRGEKLLLK